MDVRRWSRFLLSFVAVVAPSTAVVRAARAADTVFTYQGLLRQGGAPVDGQCEVQFRLFDAAMDGNPIGTTNVFDKLIVTGGVFTVLLDFGNAFDSSDRWLEIASRCPAGSGDLATLTPRQPITATPYALGLQLPSRGTTEVAGSALRITNSGADGSGVFGEATGSNGTGVLARANSGADARAVSAQSLQGYAGYFDGRVRVISPSSSESDAFVVAFELTNVARIDSNGKGFFNGGTQTGGADVAEFVLTTDAPGPGDVVEIDDERPGQFRRAATPNSTAVAGVISSEPGVSLNASTGATAEVEGPQLALVGRVPVKVTADNGAIQPGDLLVASSVPGHAMRGPRNPAPGTVIGKALAAHADGVGVVEMLVMLR
jgi:hypothetical protein